MQIILKVYSFHSLFLTQFYKKIEKQSKLFDFTVKGPIYLPTKRSTITVLKSPHVNKTAREQFGLEIHKRLFIINCHTLSIQQQNKLKLFLQYVKSLCSNIQVKVIYLTMPGKT